MSWTYSYLLSLVQTFSHKYILKNIFFICFAVAVGILPFIEDIVKVHRFEEYVFSDSNVMAVTVQIVRPIIVSYPNPSSCYIVTAMTFSLVSCNHNKCECHELKIRKTIHS